MDPAGAGQGLRACQSGRLPTRGGSLLGKEGLRPEAPLAWSQGCPYGPGRSMAWPGPVGCLPSGLREGGHGPPFVFSFLEGTGSKEGLGSLVRDGGKGLAPQGWALIKQREGVTDRPSKRDRGEQRKGSEGGGRTLPSP